jgi:transposase-like protein
MSRKPYQRYSKAFKLEAIRLAEEKKGTHLFFGLSRATNT